MLQHVLALFTLEFHSSVFASLLIARCSYVYVCTYSLSLQPEEKSCRCHNGELNENFGLVYRCTPELLRKKIKENIRSVVMFLYESVKYLAWKSVLLSGYCVSKTWNSRKPSQIFMGCQIQESNRNKWCSSLSPGPASSEAQHLFLIGTYTKIYAIHGKPETAGHTDHHRQKAQHSHKHKWHQWPHPVPLSSWSGWRSVSEKYIHIYDIDQSSHRSLKETGKNGSLARW